MKACSSLVLIAAAAAGIGIGPAQTVSGFRAVTVLPSPVIRLEAGKPVSVQVTIQIRYGYHINSNKPAEDYLIATQLTWDPVLDLESIDYPEAETVEYAFSSKPLSVYSNRIVIRSTFRAPETIPGSLRELSGKFRYQACNSRACFPPKTVPVTVAILPR